MASRTFESLENHNYRVWFAGGLVTNVTGWMSRTAQAWLVLTILTQGNAQALGYQTAAIFLPGLLLTPFVGTVADKLPKRTILMVSSAITLVSALSMALLTITGRMKLWEILALSFLQGIAMAFDGPARQAFVSEVVGIDLLPNAISLNSASFNAARLLGPGIGGVFIAFMGCGWVIMIDVLGQIVWLTALMMMNTAQLNPSRPASGRSAGFVAGVKQVARCPDLVALLAVGFAVGGLGFNFNISNAVMATEAFGRGASNYGILGSIMGVGALAAALWSARRRAPRLRYVIMGMVGYTVFNALAMISTNFWLFAILQAPVGFFTITCLVTGNSLLQTATAPQLRGRVMALWGLAITGIAPIVSPLVGWLGDQFGPRATIAFGVVAVGTITVVLVATIMTHDRIRVHLDWHRRAPFLRLDRLVTEDTSAIRR